MRQERPSFNPLQHPIVYAKPKRIAPSGWIGHIPFGMFLVEILEPGVLVELGTYTGVSYCAFCQAVRELALDTQCSAVDTWQGDPQAGYYGPEVLGDLKEHHDPLYGDFSQLLQMTFDEALGEFGEGTIDLLHIDGFHSYQAVKRDWEGWLPKMSTRGVVLLHDTAVREEGFEVWKLWVELKDRYPHFELPHEHGLGLLAVGEEISPRVEDLVSSTGRGKERIQAFFARRGDQIHADLQIQELQEEVEDFEARLGEGALPHDVSRQLREKERALRDAASELAEIKDGRAWGLIQFLWRLRLKLFPPDSARWKAARRLLSWMGGKGGEGDRTRLPASGRGEVRREGGLQAFERHREGGDERGAALAWWEDYRELKDKIQRRAEASRAVGVPAPSLISYDPTQLPAIARQLAFPDREDPLVSIVIPVWNQLQLTMECLGSVQRHTRGVPYELIVVDDGSTDGTPAVIPEIDGIQYIRNEERQGFVHSCNRGADAARGAYLLFLNNDVQVTEGWLSELVRTFQDHDHVGAVGPKILFPDGRLQEAGAAVNPDGTTELVGVFEDPRLPRYNYLREVGYCSGVCLLLRRADFEGVGGFDEAFAPAYGEDVDLCLKLRKEGKGIYYNPRAVIIHHLSATTDQLGQGAKQSLVTRHSQKLMERWVDAIETWDETRLIAFYLPQFHPIPENDAWWGKGFTDWRNVADARPNFRGHYQPHLPGELGFYDLRVEEVMEAQARLARRYGLHGFCYYYYWFGGKRLLDLPLQRLLKTGKPEIPFCLCWANENWTRAWDGHEDQVLIAQAHSPEDDRAFMESIAPFLRHPLYIRVRGKPLLLIYRVDLFPEMRETVKRWRAYCREEGIGEIYLAMMETFEGGGASPGVAPSAYGFDAAVEFPPHPFDHPFIDPPGEIINPDFQGSVHDYRKAALAYLQAEAPDYVRFRGVMPSWDNTARRQDQSTIYTHSSPGVYQAWLEAALRFTEAQYVGDERIVFVNAWNEWAEGTHLEPDQRFGHGYLEATKNALERRVLKNRE